MKLKLFGKLFNLFKKDKLLIKTLDSNFENKCVCVCKDLEYQQAKLWYDNFMSNNRKKAQSLIDNMELLKAPD